MKAEARQLEITSQKKFSVHWRSIMMKMKKKFVIFFSKNQDKR